MFNQVRSFFILTFAVLAAILALQFSNPPGTGGKVFAGPIALSPRSFLPLVLGSGQAVPPTPVPSPTAAPTATVSPPAKSVRRVNAPNFKNDAIDYASTAVFWFGQVNPLTSYSDVRVGYNNQKLFLSLNVIDRRLWYNTDPANGPFSDWDATTVYLNLDGNTGAAPGTNAYRFDAQLNWWQTRTAYQAAYRGNGSGWSRSSSAFTTASTWRGNAPNDNTDDAGWQLTYEIPFTALGLSAPPAAGTKWGLGVVLHNRDYLEYPPSPDQVWPETLAPNQPSTWGQLGFGLPQYAPPAASAQTTVTIRHGLNGAVVPDAAVGGTMGNLCGESNGTWEQWGNTSFENAPRFNIQNQSDVADWMCFSKYYVTFPLNTIPSGKVIVSATLILHEFGNSGQQEQAAPSLIQVMTVDQVWSSALTWNNAPLAFENVSRAWVNPIGTFPGWPGVAAQWNVSGAVAEAYALNRPLRLVLYEADSAMHSGKYFTGSQEPDWNTAGRPTLTVVWGNP